MQNEKRVYRFLNRRFQRREVFFVLEEIGVVSRVSRLPLKFVRKLLAILINSVKKAQPGFFHPIIIFLSLFSGPLQEMLP